MTWPSLSSDMTEMIQKVRTTAKKPFSILSAILLCMGLGRAFDLQAETEQNNGFRVAHLHALSKVLHERRFGHVGLAGVQDLDNLVLYVRVFV